MYVESEYCNNLMINSSMDGDSFITYLYSALIYQ